MRLLLALTLVACTRAPADPPLPTDITLKTGDQRAIRGLTVIFVGVKEDSRCPDNARCVWAGNAAVELRMEGGSDSVAITLNSGVEPKSIEVRGLRFTIASLLPTPMIGAPAPAAHDLTLHVESTR
jgi:hypothetical protein